MTPFRTAAAVLCACLLAASAASAADWESKEFNCAVTLTAEAGWEDVTAKVAAGPSGVPNGRVVLAMGKVVIPGTGDSFSLLAIENRDQTRMNSLSGSTLRQLEQGFVQAVGEKKSSRNLEVGGLPAYEIVAISRAGAQASTVLARFILTEKYIYAINCTAIGNREAQNPEGLKMMESFRFLTPPEKASRPLLPLAGGAAVVILIGILVVRAATKKKPA